MLKVAAHDIFLCIYKMTMSMWREECSLILYQLTQFVCCILLKIKLNDRLIQAFSLEENVAEGLQFQWVLEPIIIACFMRYAESHYEK